MPPTLSVFIKSTLNLYKSVHFMRHKNKAPFFYNSTTIGGTKCGTKRKKKSVSEIFSKTDFPLLFLFFFRFFIFIHGTICSAEHVHIFLIGFWIIYCHSHSHLQVQGLTIIQYIKFIYEFI